MREPVATRFVFEGAGLELVADSWDAVGEWRGLAILLHGGGQTRHSWARTAKRLASNSWSTVTPDARGHGDSAWDPARDYGLDAFVADLLALLSRLDEPPVLIGASLGGVTGLVAAGEHPGVVRGLVLVDVAVRVEPRGVAHILDFMTGHRDGFASLEEVADAISAYNPVRARPRNLDGLRKNVRLHDDGRWYWHWDPAFMDIEDEPQRQVDRARLRDAARNLPIPTLLVRGARSDVVSPEGMAEMVRLIPNAESVEVPGAGHMLAGDDNDVFTTRLLSFLDGLE